MFGIESAVNAEMINAFPVRHVLLVRVLVHVEHCGLGTLFFFLYACSLQMCGDCPCQLDSFQVFQLIQMCLVYVKLSEIIRRSLFSAHLLLFHFLLRRFNIKMSSLITIFGSDCEVPSRRSDYRGRSPELGAKVAGFLFLIFLLLSLPCDDYRFLGGVSCYFDHDGGSADVRSICAS